MSRPRSSVGDKTTPPASNTGAAEADAAPGLAAPGQANVGSYLLPDSTNNITLASAAKTPSPQPSRHGSKGSGFFSASASPGLSAPQPAQPATTPAPASTQPPVATASPVLTNRQSSPGLKQPTPIPASVVPAIVNSGSYQVPDNTPAAEPNLRTPSRPTGLLSKSSDAAPGLSTPATNAAPAQAHAAPGLAQSAPLTRLNGAFDAYAAPALASPGPVVKPGPSVATSKDTIGGYNNSASASSPASVDNAQPQANFGTYMAPSNSAAPRGGLLSTSYEIPSPKKRAPSDALQHGQPKAAAPAAAAANPKKLGKKSSRLIISYEAYSQDKTNAYTVEEVDYEPGTDSDTDSDSHKSDDDDDDDDKTAVKDRDWNAEYQTCLSMPEGMGKYEKLSELAKDFVYTAKTYGKIIITEMYLQNKRKTIKPIDAGGIAGGVKYRVQGIMFKFAQDPELGKGVWLYGINHRADHLAAKAANIELKSLIAYNNTHSVAPLLHYPLQALIDYRGLRLIAMSWLPLGKDTLQYGSSNAGLTAHADDLTLNEQMQKAASYLNLAGHLVGRRDSKVIHSCGDIEGHLGLDGRYYVLDFARVFPAEHNPTATKAVNGNYYLYQRLRPELVKNYPKPLNSDAFSPFSVDQAERDSGSKEVEHATAMMHHSIAELAKHIISMRAYELDTSAFNICNEMHRRGINLRHLGRLRAAIESKFAFQRQMLLSEIVARVAKVELQTIVREKMEEIRSPSSAPYISVCSDYFNTLLRNTEYWSDANYIKSRINFSFPNALSADEMAPSFNLKGALDIVKLFIRLQAMTGVKLIASSQSQLANNPGRMKVLHSDIQKMAVTIKTLHIVDFAAAKMLYLQAMNFVQENNYQLAERLFLAANEQFRAAHASNTINADILFHWALCIYQQSLIGSSSNKVVLEGISKQLETASKLDDNLDILVHHAIVLVELGALAKGDEQFKFFALGEQCIKKVVAAKSESHMNTILRTAETLYNELPQYQPEALSPTVLDFAFVNLVTAMENPKSKLDISKVVAKFTACAQWHRFSLIVQRDGCIFLRFADTLRRWAAYLQGEKVSTMEAGELYGRAAMLYEMAAFWTLKFTLGGTTYSLTRKPFNGPAASPTSATVPSANRTASGFLNAGGGLGDATGAFGQTAATLVSSTSRLTAVDKKPALNISASARMLDGVGGSANMSGSRPELTRRGGAFVSRFNHASNFQVYANPTTLSAPIQGVLSIDDRSRRLALSVLRNSHTTKDSTSVLNAFSDEPETIFRLQEKTFTCLLTPDHGDFHLTSASFMLIPTASRVDLLVHDAAASSSVYGRVCFVGFKDRIPSDEEYSRFLSVKCENMLDQHRADSVQVETFSLSKNPRQEFSVDMIATALYIRIEVGLESLAIRQISLRGGPRTNLAGEAIGGQGPQFQGLDVPVFTQCFSNPFQLLSLVAMGVYSPLLEGLTTAVLKHQVDKLKELKKPAFDLQLFNAAVGNEPRPVSLKGDTPGLEAMRLFGCQAFTAAAIERLTFAYTSIWMLELTQSNINDDGLQAIARNCGPTLSALTLKGCNHLTANSMENLVRYCPALEYLSVWEDCSEQALLRLPSFSFRLEQLDLSRCKHLTDKVIKVLPAKKYLNIGGCGGQFGDTALTQKALIKALKSWGGKILSISFSNEIVAMENKTDEETYKNQWPRMRALVDDSVIIELAKSCPNLLSLDVTFCNISDNAVLELGNSCRKLEMFISKFNTKVGEKALFILLSNTPNLKQLDLRGLRGSMSHLHVTATTLGPLSARGLTHLVLTRCYRGDDRILSNTVEYLKGTLQVLDLGLCDITDATANAIAKCTELIELNIQGCTSPTVKAISAILRHCIKLARIGLSGCNVDDEAMIPVLGNGTNERIHTLLIAGCKVGDEMLDLLTDRHSTSLRILDVRHTNISGVSLLKTTRRCASLQFLNASGCANVTEEYFKQVPKTLLPGAIVKTSEESQAKGK